MAGSFRNHIYNFILGRVSSSLPCQKTEVSLPDSFMKIFGVVEIMCSRFCFSTIHYREISGTN